MDHSSMYQINLNDPKSGKDIEQIIADRMGGRMGLNIFDADSLELVFRPDRQYKRIKVTSAIPAAAEDGAKLLALFLGGGAVFAPQH